MLVDGEIHKSDLRQSYLEAFKFPSVPKTKGSMVECCWRSGSVIEMSIISYRCSANTTAATLFWGPC